VARVMPQKEVVAALLVGLDDDLIEYVAEGVYDDEKLLPQEDLLEFVVPLLDELVEGDEARATALAEELWRRLGGDASAAASESAPPARLLTAPMSLGAGYVAPASAPEPVSNEREPLELSAKAEQKQQKEASRRAQKRAARAEAASSLAVELEEDVLKAQLRSAELRAAEGAGHLGALELGPFDVPNPGGGHNLIEEAHCVMVPGRRYGLLGRNGMGKSTLLRNIAARRVKGLPERVTVAYCHQEVKLTEEQEAWTPMRVVVDADVERRALMTEKQKLEEAGDSLDQRLTDVCERLELIGATTAEARAEALLENLGFSKVLREREMRALSGGWRVRVALAAAIFTQPDVLLLDEPTNHLSIDAVLWLTRELATSPTWASRIIVIVSHDRVFVEEVCTDVLHISGAARKLTQQRGSYSTWAQRREEQQKAWQRTASLRQAKRDKLKAYTDHGFKYGGSSGQIAMQQKKLKEIQKLDVEAETESEELAALNEDDELPLSLCAGGILQKPFAVKLSEVAFRYPGSEELLLQFVDFNIDSKSRIVLLGENGNGKTTLLKLLMGRLEPTSGEATRDPGARIAIVDQHHAAQIDLESTPLAFMLARFPGNGSVKHMEELRAHLAGCGICQRTRRHGGGRPLGRAAIPRLPRSHLVRAPTRNRPRRTHQQPRHPSGRSARGGARGVPRRSCMCEPRSVLCQTRRK